MASTAIPKAYYFFYAFRSFFLKFCPYFAHNAKLCVNGHELLKRQLVKRGIAYTALNNGISECAAPVVLPEVCAEVTAEFIDVLLRKRPARHPFTATDRRACVRYEVSVLSAKFSLPQGFDRPQQGRVFFEKVLCENLDAGRPTGCS